MGLPHQLHEERPWGSFTRFTHNEPTTVKILNVSAGEAYSLQFHHHRDEFGRVIKGAGTVQIGEDIRAIREGDEFYIPRETVHQVTGGPGGLSYLEIAFGDFDEKDIERIKDKYGRS
jgi:mannose-6-phosphate isomerase-like protein (cupin superfamily)